MLGRIEMDQSSDDEAVYEQFMPSKVIGQMLRVE